MDALRQLLRFLYIGNDQPHYTGKRIALTKEHGEQYLSSVHSLVGNGATSAISPAALIKKALLSKTLCRKDESLYALAYCAQSLLDLEARQAIFALIPEVIASSTDLFQLLQYYVLCSKNSKRCFGNAIRVALHKWYDARPQDVLVDTLLEHGSHGWTHRDVIALIHLKLSPDKQALINLYLQKSPKTDEVDGEVASPELTRMKCIIKFKTQPDAQSAVEMMEQQGLDYQILPRSLRRSGNVWETICKRMPYEQLVRSALVLQDFKLLRPSRPLAKSFSAALGNLQAITDSRIHPITIYEVLSMFIGKARYRCPVKEAQHKKSNTGIDNIEPNPTIVVKLMNAMNHSMSSQLASGIRLYITLDMRSVYQKKPICNNRSMTCYNAAILLALTYVKTEKDVTLMAFTETVDKLQAIPLTKDMSFKQATKLCEGLLLPKTKVDICCPIRQAMASKTKVDVFITIVDSLVRVNPKRTTPIDALMEYRKTMNLKMTKYVAINLSRYQQDFHFPDQATKGILEIAGCTTDTPKIIDAYSKNLFM